MLNPHSPIPLYRQLAELLNAKIREGVYTAGSRIPSEHQLAATYSIGRPTARQAVDLLVRKGLLSRRRGSGTYVRAPQQEVDLFSLDSTSASFHKKGVSTDTQIIIPVHLLNVDEDTYNPFNGRRAFFLSRLTRVDRTPVLIEDIYLHADLFAGIDRIDLTGCSLSAIAEERFYLQPSSGKQSFSIGYLTKLRARQLQVTVDTPILEVKRYLHFQQTANGVYCQLWCRTDQFVFTQNIGGTDYA